MVLYSVYHHFNYHPSFIQAVQHVVLGFTSFTMLFFLHQLWIGAIISKFHHKGVFLRSQVMEIAVLVNSSIFAIIICFVSLIGNGIYNELRIRIRVHFLHSGNLRSEFIGQNHLPFYFSYIAIQNVGDV